MANDRMSLHVEIPNDSGAVTPSAALVEAIAHSVRDVTKLRADIVLAPPGSLPNDGKVIDDKRSYA